MRQVCHPHFQKYRGVTDLSHQHLPIPFPLALAVALSGRALRLGHIDSAYGLQAEPVPLGNGDIQLAAIWSALKR